MHVTHRAIDRRRDVEQAQCGCDLEIPGCTRLDLRVAGLLQQHRQPADLELGPALDQHVGLAGDPLRVLRRAAELMRRGGRCVAEFDPAVEGVRTNWVRLESSRTIGPWFRWAAVGVDCAAALAEEVGLALVAIHPIGRRVVATLALT